jgi:hypothetical protein
VSAPLPAEASRQPLPAIPPLSNHIQIGPTELRSVADKQRLRTHPAECTVQHLFGPALRQGPTVTAEGGLPDRSAPMEQAASEGFAEPMLEVIDSGRPAAAGH